MLTLFGSPGQLAKLMLATWVSLPYNIHVHVYKKFGNQLPQVAETNADEYFLCILISDNSQFLFN